VDAPHPERGVHFILTLALLLILGGALALLSRDREAAREAEVSRNSLLRINAEDIQPEPDEQPGAIRPPEQTPIPTPLPPTPTPPPFNPEDLGLAPAPTPVPRPVPTPTLAPPTPTPVPSMLVIKDQLKRDMRRNLDEKAPVAKPGEDVTLTFRNNRSITGTLLRLEARQFQLQTSTGAQWFPYRQLLLESRLRVDASERETWLEERALEEVLKRL
jgi:hypothetical protein